VPAQITELKRQLRSGSSGFHELFVKLGVDDLWSRIFSDPYRSRPSTNPI
jgi:hypothetical protein